MGHGVVQLGDRRTGGGGDHSPPTLSSTTPYQLMHPASGPPQITDGSTTAPVAWPAAIPTYISGENPAGNQFGVDNVVIGQTGHWFWAALKGPKNPPTEAIPLTWGYRRWDRLVAPNSATGQYQVYPTLPKRLKRCTVPSGKILRCLRRWHPGPVSWRSAIEWRWCRPTPVASASCRCPNFGGSPGGRRDGYRLAHHPAGVDQH